MILGPISQSFISQRTRLHYVEWGSSSNPPLLLIHGSRDHCRSWDWVARDLAADWHIIAPDLRGHGDSEWASDGNYPIASYVYDVAELVRIRNLATFSIVAHSLGGGIASRYTALYPQQVQKLILVDGTGLTSGMAAERRSLPIDERLRTWIGDRRDIGRRHGRHYPSLEAAANRMRSENPKLSEDQAYHLTLHGVRRNEDDSYSWKFDNLQRLMPPSDGTEAEYMGLLSSIQVPTLMIWGTESYTPHPQESVRARAIPGARTAIVEGAGHWPHHDQLGWFLQTARSFLEESLY